MSAQYQTYVMMRLTRWVIWCIWRDNLLTQRPGPKRVCSSWGSIMQGRVEQIGRLPREIERPCPVDVVEAEETGRCVQALPDKLRCVIVLEYLARMTKREKVAAMQPEGTAKTFYNRLDHAYYELLGLMNDAGVGLHLPARAPVSIAA